MPAFDWTEFDKQVAIVKEHFDKTQWTIARSDVIEDVEVEYDGDPEYGHRIYLTLEGDFVLSMIRYLANKDEADTMYNKFRVRLDTFSLNKLKKQL